MPKRRDENEIAFDALQEILRRDAQRDGLPLEPKPKPEKVPSAVRAGRLGGLRGGKIRAAKLTAKKQKRALQRWQPVFDGNDLRKIKPSQYLLAYCDVQI